jgi:hypothetical protein
MAGSESHDGRGGPFRPLPLSTGIDMKRICVRSVYPAVGMLIALSCSHMDLSASRVVYNDAVTLVSLRADSKSGEFGHSHPGRLTTEQMRIVLNGIRVQDRKDPLLSLVTGKPDPVPAFSVEEIRTLAPALSKALELVGPKELVTFYRRVSDESVGLGFTTGGLFVEHRALYFILANHRNRPSDGMGHAQAVTYEFDPVNDPLFSIRASGYKVLFSPSEARVAKELWPSWDYVDPGKVAVVDLDRLLLEPQPGSPSP